jgi:hypothetical protein
LLDAGTTTDTNGAANFTQQFAVNGQRGVTTVFAVDGIGTTAFPCDTLLAPVNPQVSFIP